MAVSTHFFRLSLCASHPTLAVLSRVPRRPRRRHPCTVVAARHLPLACNAVYGKHSGTVVEQLTLCNKVRGHLLSSFSAAVAAPHGKEPFKLRCSATAQATHHRTPRRSHSRLLRPKYSVGAVYCPPWPLTDTSFAPSPS